MMRGEAVQTGAPLDCGEEGCAIRGPALYESAAGYYVGYWCVHCCEPYSRESGYYISQGEAQSALDSGDYGRI